jgi:endonuclease/exonuclease/phosphatase family metal-dependent hydrolase
LSPPGGDIAVLSRRPLQEVERLEPPPEAVDGPRTRPLRVVVDGVAIYAVHPDTPRTAAGWRRRNALLAWLGRAVRARDGARPRIIAGDFNTPPGSPYLAELQRAAGVRDAAGGGLRHPTRQPLLFAPYLALLGAPVDHVLVSPEISVAGFAVGRDVESDHLPVVADLLLPGGAQPAEVSPDR